MNWSELFRPRRLQHRRKMRSLIEHSGLFEQSWYLERYTDVRLFTGGPFKHYLLHGMSENRFPGPNFDPIIYAKRYQTEPTSSSLSAMEHYLLKGRDLGNNIFSVAKADYDAPKTSTDDVSRRERIAQSGYFDALWYSDAYEDLKGTGLNPLEHFINYGSRERRSPGPRFDALWYAEEYLLFDPISEPLIHYLEEGEKRAYLTAPPSYQQDWRRRYFTLTEEDCLLLDREHGETTFFYLHEGAEDALAAFLASASSEQARAKVYVVASSGVKVEGLADVDVLRDVRSVNNIITELPPSNILTFVRGAVTLEPHCSEILQSYANGIEHYILISDFLECSPDATNPYFVFKLSDRIGAALRHRIHLFAINKNTFFSAVGASTSVDELFSLKSYGVYETHTICINHFTYIDKSPPQLVIGEPTEHTWSPSVSIIIPTKDGLDYLKACIDSIINMTIYSEDIEIIIVDNRSVEQETLIYLNSLCNKKKFKVIKFNDEFNYSSINNMAAAAATGEVLVFLNNDTSVIKDDWLSILVNHLSDRRVGVVGAKLLYPDGLVQHGGVVIGIQGVAAHSHALLPSNDSGFQNLNMITREITAITGACLAIRRKVFYEVGGFDANFKVAFNDIALCLTVMQAGFRNVFVSSAILYHHESKSRGYDTTPEKKQRFFEETLMFNRIYRRENRNDAYYSRSLSLEACYLLAEPPRGVRPWRLRTPQGSRKVLILSSTFQTGHGVAVVIDQQVDRLLQMGFEVWLGGPVHDDEIIQQNTRRIHIDTPKLAAKIAVRYRFDLVLVHTPPFYSIIRYVEDFPAVVLYDYGEPPPEFFIDQFLREEVNREKLLCFAMSRHKAAISQAVSGELPGESLPVLPLANSHLASWTDTSPSVRERVRHRLGWTHSYVILTVCRFYAAERRYKGIDDFVDIGTRVKMMTCDKAEVVVCGRGTKSDIEYLKARGVRVFANVSDEELIEIYHAADAFVSMSKWEGYNLPIGQALALGLPVLASKIPAHEAFGIETFTYQASIVSRLVEMVQEKLPSRVPRVWKWEESLDIFEEFVTDVLRESREKALSRL